MYNNDEPREPGPGAVDVSPAIPAARREIGEPLDRAPSAAHVRDVLFEDILDVEGPLRLALARGCVAPVASTTPGPAAYREDACTTLLLGSIESISVRVDAPIGALLRAQSQDLQAAAEALDANRLSCAQSALVDTLAALRHRGV
jgi:hypothetical protein